MPTPDPATAIRSLDGFLHDWLAFQRWYRQVPAVVVGLSVGDEVEVEIEGIGILRNPVVGK